MIKVHGEITESALVHDGRAALHGLNFNTDGVNDLAVTVHDAKSASGKVLWRQTLKGPDCTGGVVFAAHGLAVEHGIYVNLATSGAASANVFYRL